MTVLQGEEKALIHDCALRVLEQVGMVIYHAEALNLLAEAGAAVDRNRNLVRIPRALVEECLSLAPCSVDVAGLTSDRNVRLEPDGTQYFRPVGGPEFILDYGTTEYRRSTYQDVVNWLRVVEALPNIHVTNSIHASDLPVENRDLHIAAASLLYSTKPIMLSAYDGRSMRWIAELAKAIPGQSQPRIMVLTSTTSPLTYTHAMADLLVQAVRQGIVPRISSSGMSGFVSPVTLAGSVMQIHAEILAGIVVAQLVTPGTPIIYAPHPVVGDLRSASACYGYTEGGLMAAATIGMGRYLNLPTAGNGLTSDAIVPDQQACIDKLFTGWPAALAGANVIGGCGSLGLQGAGSLEQLVIDDEIAGRIGRYQRGIAVDEDTLAFEAVARVGPEGSYLLDEHTLRHMRNEFWMSPLANRRNPASWLEAGGKDLLRRATDRVQDIVAKPAEPVLSGASVEELGCILNEADQALCSLQ
jgi:trimethylamine--corrinoid protein Co-methyltransferase